MWNVIFYNSNPKFSFVDENRVLFTVLIMKIKGE